MTADRGSVLPADTEEIVRRVIGCAIRVHRTLGVGFLESTYREATCLELDAQGLAFEREKSIPVLYRGRLVGRQRLDLLVGGLVIVEIKAVSALGEVHQSQLIAYLRASGLRIGLLMNFHAVRLSLGLKRIVL